MKTTVGRTQPPATHPAPPTLPRESMRLLGCRVDKLTYAQAVAHITAFLSDGQPHQLITVNPLMILEAQRDAGLAELINHADLVVPESSGILWASQQVGTPLEQIIPGIDLFQSLCLFARDTGRSVFLLGAQQGVADSAAVKLAALYPGLCIKGTHHGYFRRQEDEEAVVAQIREAAPDFLFVALNVPEQEKWIHRNLQVLGVPVVMGVGGSFDVLSGRLRRAPVWMRQWGIEWVFRTLQEPWRFKRIVHLPVFSWKILRHRGIAKR